MGDELTGENKDLKNQMPSKQAEIDQLKSENEGLKSKSDDLAKKEQEIAELKIKNERIPAIETEMAKLQTNLQTEEAAKIKLDEENGNLQKWIEELDGQLQELDR